MASSLALIFSTLDLSGRFVTKRTTTPVLPDLFPTLVIVGLHRLDEFAQGVTIVGVNVSDGHAGGGLPPTDTSQPRFVLHNAVGDAHLPAEGWQEHDKLDRINVIGDNDELSFIFLDEGGDSVDPVPHHGSALGGRVHYPEPWLQLSPSVSPSW